jgi:hypothetical protein
MASITIDDGKFAAYRAADTTGANPCTEILAETDGGACGLKDTKGRVWYFRCYDEKLEYKRSTDTDGETLGDWTEIIGADIADGIPAAIEYPTAIIEVCFYKTDDKFYRIITKDWGATWETAEEIVTA